MVTLYCKRTGGGNPIGRAGFTLSLCFLVHYNRPWSPPIATVHRRLPDVAAWCMATDGTPSVQHISCDSMTQIV